LIPATAPLFVDLESDSIYLIWLGESVELTAVATGGTPPLTYNWGPDQYLSCTTCPSTTASPLLNSNYAVTVTDANGCTAVTGAYIEIMFAMYIPNTFTPNGDGDNDMFYAVSASVKEFNMRIFDRWGEEVFTTNNIHEGWDGTYRGLESKQDVYVFRVEAKFMNGKYEELIGQVNLLR
jgi:gliding motility-associated-like protein